jgi:hypothetical protein
MVMTPQETAQYEADLQAQSESGFQKGVALSQHPGYGKLFDALEAESLDTLRYCNEEIAFWSRITRNEKDKIRKFIYGANVNDFKDKIEDTHHAIIERRELRKEFERISG